MKKLIAALVIGTLTAAMLVGCGQASDDATSSNADVNAQITQADNDASGTDAQAAGTDDAAGTGTDDAAGTQADDGTAAPAEVKTVKEGVLTMATNATFPPYEYYESDAIIGIDAEIAGAVAEKLGLELKIEDMEFDSIILAVTQGKADLGLAGMTVTEERLEAVDFSDSYATGIQAVIVTEDSEITGISDLDGKQIGVKQGKVDAVIIDNQPALAFIRNTDGLKILETEYAVEDYAAAIAKGNDALLTAVNGALAELKDDGTLQSIIDKYIVSE